MSERRPYFPLAWLEESVKIDTKMVVVPNDRCSPQWNKQKTTHTATKELTISGDRPWEGWGGKPIPRPERARTSNGCEKCLNGGVCRFAMDLHCAERRENKFLAEQIYLNCGAACNNFRSLLAIDEIL